MAIIDDGGPWDRERITKLLLVGLAIFVGGVAGYRYWTRPPQMGASDEAFRTVDALYTAVRSRDQERLGECQQRLHGYRASGKLAPQAGDALDSIVRKAQSGQWQAATERLYHFMLAQRREEG